MNKPVIDSQTKALLSVGFLKPVDAVFAAFLLLGAIVFGVLLATDQVSLTVFFVFSALGFVTFQAWVFILMFRVLWFVLQCLAAIKTIPADAAKLAVTFARQ